MSGNQGDKTGHQAGRSERIPASSPNNGNANAGASSEPEDTDMMRRRGPPPMNPPASFVQRPSLGMGHNNFTPSTTHFVQNTTTNSGSFPGVYFEAGSSSQVAYGPNSLGHNGTPTQLRPPAPGIDTSANNNFGAPSMPAPQHHAFTGNAPPTGPLMERPPRSIFNPDPMSGSELQHPPNVRTHQLQHPQHMAEKLNPIRRGRGVNECSSDKYDYEKRPVIWSPPFQNKFNLKKAEKDISCLLRRHYKGDFEWDDVTATTRNQLWKDFGYKYRWDKGREGRIVQVWEKLNRDKFREMLSHAKKDHDQGWMSRWLKEADYRKLMNHWEDPKFKEASEQKSKNRGTVKDENGNVTKKAPATYMGGSISMVDHDNALHSDEHSLTPGSQEELMMQAPRQSPFVYMKTHVLNPEEFKNKGKKKKSKKAGEGSSANDLVEEGDVLDQLESTIPDDSTAPVPKWANPKYAEVYDRYCHLADEAWHPETRPSDHEWWSEALWVKAAGGVSKGRVLGVAKGVVIHDAGYSERRGRVAHTTPGITQASVDQSMKTVIDELKGKVTELEGELKDKSKEMDDAMKIVKHWLKANKAPMPPDVQSEDDDDNNDG